MAGHRHQEVQQTWSDVGLCVDVTVIRGFVTSADDHRRTLSCVGRTRIVDLRNSHRAIVVPLLTAIAVRFTDF